MDFLTYTDVAAWALGLIIAVCDGLNRGQSGLQSFKAHDAIDKFTHIFVSV